MCNVVIVSLIELWNCYKNLHINLNFPGGEATVAEARVNSRNSDLQHNWDRTQAAQAPHDGQNVENQSAPVSWEHEMNTTHTIRDRNI